MVPTSGSVFAPLVNVVPETVMCQPAPVPVLSVTVNSLSAAFGSTACWSSPLSVKDQVSDAGAGQR